jgi:Protein of unknown function (DUF3489)
MTKASAKSRPRSKSPKRPKKKSNAARVLREAGTITKHDRVLGLLRAKCGTTIAAMSKATGWQSHSVRGFLTGVVKRKLGLTMTSEKTKSGRIYRIVGAKPSAPSRSVAVMQETNDA